MYNGGKPVILRESFNDASIDIGSVVLVQSRSLRSGVDVMFCGNDPTSANPNYRLATSVEEMAYHHPPSAIKLALFDKPRNYVLALGNWVDLGILLENSSAIQLEGTTLDYMFALIPIFPQFRMPEGLAREIGKNMVEGDYNMNDHQSNKSLLSAVSLFYYPRKRLRLETLITENLPQR